MTLIALFAAASSPTLFSPSASDGDQKKPPTTAFHLLPSLFDSAADGLSASCFHRYENETSPCCVLNKNHKVAPKKQDDTSSPAGGASNPSELVRAGMSGWVVDESSRQCSKNTSLISNFLPTLGYYYLPLLKWSVTAIKKNIYIYIQPRLFRVSGPLWRASQASRSVYSVSTTCKQLRDTIRTVDVLHSAITVNCEILPDASTTLMFALFLRNSSCVFCMCVFEQRLHTSGCLLFAKEPLTHVYFMFPSKLDFTLGGGGLHAKLLYGNAPIYMSVSVFWVSLNLPVIFRQQVFFSEFVIIAAVLVPLDPSLVDNKTSLFSVGSFELEVKAKTACYMTR